MVKVRVKDADTMYDVPVGSYPAKLADIKDMPPSDAHPDWGASYVWEFEVLSGPQAGKRASCFTKQEASMNNNLGKLLAQLLGRAVEEDEDVELQDFIGRTYTILVGRSKDGTKARVNAVMPANHPVPGPSPTPARPAPASNRPAPARANAPAPKPVIQWWVDDGQEVQLRPESDVQQFVDAGKGEAIKLMREDQEGGWKTPAELGFRTLSPEATGDIPF